MTSRPRLPFSIACLRMNGPIGWARLDRGTYRFVLGPGLAGIPDMSERGAEIASKIREAVGQRFPITVEIHPR